MKKLVEFLVLPAVVSDFERRYLARVNRIALFFFAMHVPVFMLVAWANHTRPFLAGALSLAVLVGPTLAHRTLANPRTVSLVHGVSAMFMGGLLVHFGQGPVQIEMHFYFFALVAMCAVFGNPLVIVAAAGTVALHHLLVWALAPQSVFNYEASWWVVGVHASFVVLESIATCFIARSFFDNVIGLEKIVQARTRELDKKNRDMRMLLDNVQQGFLTIDGEGLLAQERSAAVERWFGPIASDASWFDCLSKVAPEFAEQTRVGWAELAADVMPLEMVLDQLPHKLVMGATVYRVEYCPIGAAPHKHFLVIITDVTSDIEREIAETERREAMAIFERVLGDRSGFETFFEEASHSIEVITSRQAGDAQLVRRLLHTLKGNTALFGLASVAAMCHSLEDVIEDSGRLPPATAFAPLIERWSRLARDVERLLGSDTRLVQIDASQYDALVYAVEHRESYQMLQNRVRALKLEATQRRLQQFAEQARRIAQRLDKIVDVRVEDNGVRLEPKRWAPFWTSFIHAVRNAVDHGIERPDIRVAAGKPAHGVINLRTANDRASGRVVIEMSDDGCGVDWTAIADRAARAGLPTSTAADLERALFVDGVSTAKSVTDISGRGIGMGALMAATRDLGGEMSVESGNRGTRIRMVIPAPA